MDWAADQEAREPLGAVATRQAIPPAPSPLRETANTQLDERDGSLLRYFGEVRKTALGKDDEGRQR